MTQPNMRRHDARRRWRSAAAGRCARIRRRSAPSIDALRRGAIVVDRSHRGRMRVFGEKSGEALTGLVTNDVLGDAARTWRYAAALSSKGSIVADVRIFAGVASYLVDTSARAWPGCSAMVKKYVNPRVSGYRDDSHAIRDLGVFGVERTEHRVGDHWRDAATCLGARAVRPRGRRDRRRLRDDRPRAGHRASRDTSCSFHSSSSIACGSARSIPARRRRGSARGRSRASKPGASNGESTSTTRRFRRKRTSTISTPSRTRRAATSGRRSSLAFTSAAT